MRDEYDFSKTKKNPYAEKAATCHYRQTDLYHPLSPLKGEMSRSDRGVQKNIYQSIET